MFESAAATYSFPTNLGAYESDLSLSASVAGLAAQIAATASSFDVASLTWPCSHGGMPWSAQRVALFALR